MGHQHSTLPGRRSGHGSNGEQSTLCSSGEAPVLTSLHDELQLLVPKWSTPQRWQPYTNSWRSWLPVSSQGTTGAMNIVQAVLSRGHSTRGPSKAATGAARQTVPSLTNQTEDQQAKDMRTKQLGKRGWRSVLNFKISLITFLSLMTWFMSIEWKNVWCKSIWIQYMSIVNNMAMICCILSDLSDLNILIKQSENKNASHEKSDQVCQQWFMFCFLWYIDSNLWLSVKAQSLWTRRHGFHSSSLHQSAQNLSRSAVPVSVLEHAFILQGSPATP